MKNDTAPRAIRARLASDPDAPEVSETLPNGDTITGHPYAVRQMIASMKRQARRNARWPRTREGHVDTRRALYFLIASLPSLADYVRGCGAGTRKIKVPLTKADLLAELEFMAFDVLRFITWATGAHRTSATTHAARFVLSVWNPNADYRDLAQELGLDREAAILQPFNLSMAIGCFDDRHTRAVLRWVEAPFWP